MVSAKSFTNIDCKNYLSKRSLSEKQLNFLGLDILTIQNHHFIFLKKNNFNDEDILKS